MNFKDIALHVPEILIPAKDVDLEKWSVVACDQYTSEPEKWESIRDFTSGNPSTLNLVFPEVYLNGPDHDDRIERINRSMKRYLDEGIIAGQKPGFILVDRKTSLVPSRKGLVVALDLEHYDFSDGSKSLIRATEGTVIDRLPPRIKIRENAPVEVPHIMVLIDDPEKSVIEPLFEKDLKKVYDTELMMGSGHVTGYMIDDEATINEIASNLSRLADPEIYEKKYNITAENILLYAMGDGNHSLATAKTIWERIKKSVSDKQTIMNHPARYSLVEIVNVHDEGLDFEPIHRVVFNVKTDQLLMNMKSFFEGQGSHFSYDTSKPIDLTNPNQGSDPDRHLIPFVSKESKGLITIKSPKYYLEVASLQSFLDDYMDRCTTSKIDYIHGEDVVTELCSQEDNLGFYLPAISKQDLFKTIILDGALPRKTFSMGLPDEKRFYLECRRII